MKARQNPYGEFKGNAARFDQTTPEVADIVNCAIHLGRPILVEGEAGCGKTTLARAIAAELGLPEPVAMVVKSTSQAKDLLYRFNALQRLQDIQDPNKKEARYVYPYITLQPLGQAIRGGKAQVVLIDEIDKADIDFPNDLLEVLQAFRFAIDDLPFEEDAQCREANGFGRVVEAAGEVRPIVVITEQSREAASGAVPTPLPLCRVEISGRPRGAGRDRPQEHHRGRGGVCETDGAGRRTFPAAARRSGANGYAETSGDQRAHRLDQHPAVAPRDAGATGRPHAVLAASVQDIAGRRCVCRTYQERARMTAVANELLLFGVFQELVTRKMPLSVSDYLDLLRALDHGFGAPRADRLGSDTPGSSRARLRRLCEILWARNEDDVRLIGSVFAAIPPPSEVEVREIEHRLAEVEAQAKPAGQGRVDEEPENRVLEQDRTPSKRPADARAPRLAVAFSGPSEFEGIPLPSLRVSVDRPTEAFIVHPQAVLPERTLSTLWRRFRTMSRRAVLRPS